MPDYRTPLLVSPHGLVLLYSVGNTLHFDGEACYVDDLLDGFDSWDGTGSLKAHIQLLFQREELINALAPEPTRPVEKRLFAVLKLIHTKESELLAAEPEDGLLKARELYLAKPKHAISRMLSASRASEKMTFTIDP